MLNATHQDEAFRRDAEDPISCVRDEFYFDPEDQITYFDGNSLGRLPLATLTLSDDLVRRQWGQRLLRSWTDDWMALSTRIGDKIGRLVGAGPGETVVADSTSVVLYKLLMAALRARPDRSRIVTDDMNFPSDLYIMQGAAETLGSHINIEMVSSPDDVTLPTERILEAIDKETAVVVLSHVSFKSSYIYDMKAITQRAHDFGALVVWDVSHSAGALAVDLTGSGVDLAVGCCYKYLNGGPGAPAFLFVNRELQSSLVNPIAGWFGHETPFDFVTGYRPAEHIGRFLTGTPPVVSIALIEPGIDLMLEVGIESIRTKSVQLTDFLIRIWECYLKDHGFVLKTPRDPDVRGSHVSFGHKDARRINRALREHRNIYADFRAPDNLRIGITPLYMSFKDVLQVGEALLAIMSQGLHTAYPENPDEVII